MSKHKSHTPSSDDTWRVFRIMAEFVEGFEVLSKVGPCVTIFGSARTPHDHPYYKLAYDTASCAVKHNYGVISGGGPGIMEAANKGAFEAGGKSIGLNIQLPFEQVPNPYIRQLINFRHFFCRKVMFLKYTSAVIVLPGGYGTMDEMFETLTLIQTQKASDLPLILMGSDYWGGLLEWLKNSMEKLEYIDPADLQFIKVIDDPETAIETIDQFYRKRETDVNFI